MFFETLKIKWRESLEIFGKKNFKLFVLVGLNTFRRSSILLVKKFWWLFLLLFSSIVLFVRLMLNSFAKDVEIYSHLTSLKSFSILESVAFLKSVSSLFWIYGLFCILIFSLIYFFSYLAVRPSLELKDYRYFSSYLKRFIGFSFLCLILPSVAIFPLSLVSILFFLDSSGGFRSFCSSIVNGFKLVVFYFPAFLILGSAYFLLTLFSSLVAIIPMFFTKFAWVFLFISTALSFVFWLLYLSFIVVFYIKIKHKDFSFFHKVN